MIPQRSIILNTRKNDFKTSRQPGKYDHLPVHERLYIQHKEVDQKRKEACHLSRLLAEDESLQQCTFQPKLSPRSLALAHGIADEFISLDQANASASIIPSLPRRARSPQQFYHDMIKFKQEKQRNIEEAQRVKKEKELEECRISQRRSISPKLSKP